MSSVKNTGKEILDSLFNSGSFSECIELCIAELEGNSRSAVHLDFLYRCYYKLNKHDQAIDSLIQLFDLDQQDDFIAKQIAINYQALNRFDNAIKWYQVCIEINPMSGVYHNNLATLHIVCGDSAKGIQLLDRAIELDNSLVEPHMVLAAWLCLIVNLIVV